MPSLPLVRDSLASLLAEARRRLVENGTLPASVENVAIEIDVPKQAGHGDFMTNFALVAAKPSGMNPRAVAEALVDDLRNQAETKRTYPTSTPSTPSRTSFDSIEIAGPGFINLTLAPGWAAGFLSAVQSTEFAHSVATTPKKINVEFVSVNPNGPITVGSGRGAAYGSTLCNVLAAAGHAVHREYYVNDGVNSEQMRLFAESVRSFVLGLPLPEGGYRGDYVRATATCLERLRASGLFAASILLDKGFLPADEFVSPEEVYVEVNKAVKARLGLISESTSHRSLAFFVERAIDYIREVPSFVSRRWISQYQLQKSIVVSLTSVSYAAFEVERVGDKSTLPLERARQVVDDMVWRVESDSNANFDFDLSSEGIGWFQEYSQEMMLERQRLDLTTFGVTFDTWFSEQSLHDGGQVQAELEELEHSGGADDQPFRLKLKLAKGGRVEDVEKEDQAAIKAEEGDEEIAATGDSPTVWLRSTKFGDDMDRVLRRKDGRLTYIASDVAYHKDKFNRPADGDKLITVLGPDHHGYIGRLTAVVAAMLLADGQVTVTPFDEPLSDIDAKIYATAEERDCCRAATALAREKLDVQIFQIVRFVKDGKPAPMRKRDGNIYALIDLVNEIGEKARPSGTTEEKQQAGRDVARFFYLMRHHDTAMDFDLDLAEKQSDENPVFYAQYAHARICSVLDKAAEAGFPAAVPTSSDDPLWSLLTEPKEKALALKVLDLRYEVARCAEDYAVNRLTTFAVELARTYHAFYDACRVIDLENRGRSQARVALCAATRSALQAVFGLLGIGAPERMERES